MKKTPLLKEKAKSAVKKGVGLAVKLSLLLGIAATPLSKQKAPWEKFVYQNINFYSYLHPTGPLTREERLGMPMKWEKPWKESYYRRTYREYHEDVEKYLLEDIAYGTKKMKGDSLSLEENVRWHIIWRKWEKEPPDVLSGLPPVPLYRMTMRFQFSDNPEKKAKEIVRKLKDVNVLYRKKFDIEIPTEGATLYVVYGTPGLSIRAWETKDTTIFLKKLGEVEALKLTLYTTFDENNKWVYYYSPLGVVFWLEDLVRDVAGEEIDFIPELMTPGANKARPDFYSSLTKYTALVTACKHFPYTVDKIKKRYEEALQLLGDEFVAQLQVGSPEEAEKILRRKCEALEERRSMDSRMRDFTRRGFLSIGVRGRGFIVAEETIELERGEIKRGDYTPLMHRTTEGLTLPTFSKFYHFVTVWSTLIGNNAEDTVILFYVNPKKGSITAKTYYQNSGEYRIGW